eukprot:2067310-Amphidinium_carterae.1
MEKRVEKRQGSWRGAALPHRQQATLGAASDVPGKVAEQGRALSFCAGAVALQPSAEQLRRVYKVMVWAVALDQERACRRSM